MKPMRARFMLSNATSFIFNPFNAMNSILQVKTLSCVWFKMIPKKLKIFTITLIKEK